MKLDRNILVYWTRLGLTLTVDDLEDHAVALAARLAEAESLLRLMTAEMDPQPNDFRLVDEYFRRTISADVSHSGQTKPILSAMDDSADELQMMQPAQGHAGCSANDATGMIKPESGSL